MSTENLLERAFEAAAKEAAAQITSVATNVIWTLPMNLFTVAAHQRKAILRDQSGS